MFESWLGAQLGRDLDCAACARHAEGAEAAALRQDARALELWAPVLDGDLVCAHQPHGVLGSALMVLLRQDEMARAVHCHLHGYRISRGKAKFRAAIGEHLEFCALTGNEHRGLELLSEHAGWLTQPEPGLAAQAEFLTGASVLLARLVALGHTDLTVPMPPSPGASVPAGENLTVGVLRGFVDTELDSLVGRLTHSEQENGHEPGYASRLRIRRLRQPALTPYDLPVRSTLREPSAPEPPYAEPAAAAAQVPGTEDLYALTDTLFQAGELDEVEPALRQVIERSAAAGAPWHAARAEVNLSRLAGGTGDAAEAVRQARAAVMDCVDPQLRGPAALTLATALWELDGREEEAVLPALEAASIFSANEQRSDAAMARLRAADAQAFIGRRRTATELYNRSFTELENDDFWDPDEYGTTLARHQMQYGRTLLQAGQEEAGLAQFAQLRTRAASWEQEGVRFEIAVNAAYALRDSDMAAHAFEAFLHAAELAGADAERLQMKVRCLRSAAWLGYAQQPERSAALMDEAGAALVRSLDGEDEPTRAELRLELAETHLQRAELTYETDLAAAEQDAVAAYRGLRRGLSSRSADEFEPRALTGLYGRIADAAVLLGQLELARYGDRHRPVERIRELIGELEGPGPDGFAELVKSLTDQAGEFAGADTEEPAADPRGGEDGRGANEGANAEVGA